MDEIKINTEVLKDVAENISSYTTDLMSEYEKINRGINELSNHWSGSAANDAFSKYENITRDYIKNNTSSISVIMKNYAKVLKDVVGEGYEDTEDVNTNLAAAFK